MEVIMSEVYLTAISGNLEKLSAFSREELTDECVNMARYIVSLQSYIASGGKKDDSRDLVNSLKQEVEELKAKRPGGKQVIYTTKEKKRVLDMKKRGAVMREICEATGMSMSTVKRILRTES